MRGRLNCWEYQRCGRESGGANVDERGPCPASVDGDGALHHGQASGRSCWTVEHTLCEGCGHNSILEKRAYCLKCSFYNRVFVEEGPEFDSETLLPENGVTGRG